jgi:4,5-DOPA dioxygenase extradiol
MTSQPANIAALAGHRDAALAVPTPEHFLPLAYLAGLAHASRSTPRVLVDGFTFGSVSMASYVLDT